MQAAAFHNTSTFNPALGLPVAWNEMFSHRGALVRFAKTRLHDPMLAEDVVHDVFEAVLSGRAAFAGRSALKSWLTAILKNKIVDLVRQRTGTGPTTSCCADLQCATSVSLAGDGGAESPRARGGLAIALMHD